MLVSQTIVKYGTVFAKNDNIMIQHKIRQLVLYIGIFSVLHTTVFIPFKFTSIIMASRTPLSDILRTCSICFISTCNTGASLILKTFSSDADGVPTTDALHGRQLVRNATTIKCCGLTYKHLLNMGGGLRIADNAPTERIAISKYNVIII